MSLESEPMPAVHAEALLLPWYLGGELGATERRQVEQHLAGCTACRGELAQLAGLRSRYRATLAAEPEPAASVRDQLMARLAVAETTNARPLLWLRALYQPAWMPVAASVLIVMQFAALGWLLMHPVAPSGPVARAVPTAATRLRITFAGEASQAQVVGALRGISARIVAGPDASGAYLIELDSTSPTALAQQLKALRAQPALVRELELAPP